MTITIILMLMTFSSGFCFGIVLGDHLARKDKNILDLNNDGKVNIKDAEKALDLNEDGKVDSKDFDIAKKNLKRAAEQINKIKKVK